MLSTLVKTAIFVLPLGLDVLSASTALGTLGLTGWARWRVSLVLASCQISAMLIGLVLGAELAKAIGLQGVIASQVGLFLGARLGARFQQAAGRLAAVGLVLIGLYQLVEQLTTG
ncbi:MAG TPA: hypothetical protein VFA63_14455 [Pseudonocardiaceae bacterium]|nr:hypothetical protein [Pseudonocardiaceae bacterium]